MTDGLTPETIKANRAGATLVILGVRSVDLRVYDTGELVDSVPMSRAMRTLRNTTERTIRGQLVLSDENGIALWKTALRTLQPGDSLRADRDSWTLI